MHCEEQKDRAETAECQLSNISQEYRTRIGSRDAEIRRLKTENERLRNETRGSSPLRQLAQTHMSRSGGALTHLAQGRIETGFHGMDQDEGLDWNSHYDASGFNDIISSQTEIESLRQELSREREALQLCKSAAHHKVSMALVGAGEAAGY